MVGIFSRLTLYLILILYLFRMTVRTSHSRAYLKLPQINLELERIIRNWSAASFCIGPERRMFRQIYFGDQFVDKENLTHTHTHRTLLSYGEKLSDET